MNLVEIDLFSYLIYDFIFSDYIGIITSIEGDIVEIIYEENSNEVKVKLFNYQIYFHSNICQINFRLKE